MEQYLFQTTDLLTTLYQDIPSDLVEDARAKLNGLTDDEVEIMHAVVCDHIVHKALYAGTATYAQIQYLCTSQTNDHIQTYLSQAAMVRTRNEGAMVTQADVDTVNTSFQSQYGVGLHEYMQQHLQRQMDSLADQYGCVDYPPPHFQTAESN